jgi:imidazole glycerol phosphate synthase subunit HisF
MARDIFHEIVKEALIKDGWTITHDPLILLPKDEGGIQTDMGAEKILVAEKGLTKIAVEVKSFLNPSIIHEFSKAFGQYQVYLDVLEMTKNDRTMYLAMPYSVYYYLKQKEYFNYIVKKHSMKLIIFLPKDKKIKTWIE